MEVRLKTIREGGDVNEPKTFAVDAEKEIKIGRFKKSDVHLPQAGVSNQHAVIKLVPGEGNGNAPRLVLIDQSGNGTSVYTPSGSSIDLQKGQELPLENGSVIRIPTRVKEDQTPSDIQVEWGVPQEATAARTDGPPPAAHEGNAPAVAAPMPPQGGAAAIAPAAIPAGAPMGVYPTLAAASFAGTGLVMHPAIAAAAAVGAGFAMHSMPVACQCPWQQFTPMASMAPAAYPQLAPSGGSANLPAGVAAMAARRPLQTTPIAAPAVPPDTSYGAAPEAPTGPRTPPLLADMPIRTPPKQMPVTPPRDTPQAADTEAMDTSAEDRWRQRSRSRDRAWGKRHDHCGADDDDSWGNWQASHNAAYDDNWTRRATMHTNGADEDWNERTAAPREMAGFNNRPRSPGASRPQADVVQQGPSKAGNFTIILKKREDMERLGVNLNSLAGEGRTGLEVLEILPDGLLQEWNVQHPSLAVEVKDQLCSVNGLTGAADATEMVEAMKFARELRIVVHRPSLQEAADESVPWRPAKRPLPVPVRPKLTLANRPPEQVTPAKPAEKAPPPAAPTSKMQAAPAPSR